MMKTLLLVLALALSARADSFSSVEVLQKTGMVQLSNGAMLSQSVLPNARMFGSPTGYLMFSFPLQSVAALFTSTFTIDWTWPSGFSGPWTTTLMTWVDASQCNTNPCEALFFLALPKFSGVKSASVSFTFGSDRSAEYHFLLHEPVPEPTTLLLFGTGILALGMRYRRAM